MVWKQPPIMNMSPSNRPKRHPRSGRLPICRLAVGVVVLVMAAPGCDSGHPALLRATGTVKFRGQPVAGAGVCFLSKTGPAASGATDAQGRFQLTTFDPNDGARAGTYAVTVTKRVQGSSEDVPGALRIEKGGKEGSKEVVFIATFLPDRYGDLKRTPLSAVVSPGNKNDFTFELTDEPREP